MWWLIEKKYDDSKKVAYTYGCESDEQTGEIVYDRIADDFIIVKLADGDTEKGVRRLFQHLYHAIIQENCPDFKRIVTG